MIVSIIAAVAKNMVIGKDNDLIWHLPKDMKFFTQTTKGHNVIMGRKNYLSIPDKYRPLPGRNNIIATRQIDFEAPNCDIVNSIEEGIEIARKNGDDECFIIGGGEIYKYALDNDLADKMYISWIDREFEGDTYFPKIRVAEWDIADEIVHLPDETNPYPFTINIYNRLPRK